MTDLHVAEDGQADATSDVFDWDSAPPEPGESHRLPDWYHQIAENPAQSAEVAEPLLAARQWSSRPVSPRNEWHVAAMILLIAFALVKVLAILVFVHVDLAAAHSGIATNALAYGLVLLHSGFTMRWERDIGPVLG